MIRWNALRVATGALLATCAAAPVFARQEPVVLTVSVRSHAGVVADARVAAGAAIAHTDSAGRAALNLRPGAHAVIVGRLGYVTTEIAVTIRAARDTTITVYLEEDALEHEAIIVSSTRADRRIEDEPLRVEVIGREEIEEKLLMTPGDIAMLLNETAGLRVQPTAPALGGAGVRIQGLRGRYTQILSDGLPLHGGQTGALGALQIPPMDLGQVEVIKGVASALYGASALGGVVNLLSRRPDAEGERELLLNQSTLGGSDAIVWASAQLSERWGYTLLAGAHRQTQTDVDADGWGDLPAFRRAIVRPRIFWQDGSGSTFLVTVGGMAENREGGTMQDEPAPPGGSFTEVSNTRRADAGVIGRLVLSGTRLVSIRGSAVVQDHDHRFGNVREPDMHTTAFAEVALSASHGPHSWLIGAALQHERYTADSLPEFDYVHTVPGIFVQDEFAATSWLTLALSGRVDHHNVYGTFANPRISLLLRPADEWSVRTSAGTGFYAPTPWTEETESIGLSRLVPTGLSAERARSASLDIGRTIGPLELNATVFGSSITDPVQARPAPGDPSRIALFNADGVVRTAGTELLARYHAEGLHITATHVYMRSTEPDPDGTARREVPLTPRHTAGIVAALEREGRGRLGFEVYYTGTQQLADNPFRTESEPYVIVGFLGEHRFGPARVFLNAENIFDTRQTRHDPLLLPTRAADGRWLTEVWAPLDGRSFNAGVRLNF